MNIYRDSAIPFTQFGGTTMSSELSNFNKPEQWLLTYITEASFSKTTSLPDGNNHPTTWRMPLKPGAISSRNRVVGSGSAYGTRTYGIAILANLSASGGISNALTSIGIAILSSINGSGTISSASIGEGRSIEANITGSGTISQAIISLLIQIYAAISGSGTISQSELQAYLNALADLTGSGEITESDLKGLGELIAILEGEGLIDSLLTGTGELTSNIKSYGNLTPENVRDLVWQAAANNYIDPITMGGKLNSAVAAGNPWDVLFGSMTAGEMFEAIFKITNNKVTKSGNTITIYENDELTVWKTFDLSLGGRVEQ